MEYFKFKCFFDHNWSWVWMTEMPTWDLSWLSSVWQWNINGNCKQFFVIAGQMKEIVSACYHLGVSFVDSEWGIVTSKLAVDGIQVVADQISDLLVDCGLVIAAHSFSSSYDHFLIKFILWYHLFSPI